MPRIKNLIAYTLLWMLTTGVLLSGCSGDPKKMDINSAPSTGAALGISGELTISPTASPSPEPSPIPRVTPVPASKPQGKKSIPILYYHAVNDHIEGIEELFVSPIELEKQMAFLKRNDYTVITFDQIKDIRNIENPIIITFDDGYEDNYSYAYPVLKKYGFQATIFLCSEFIDKSFYLSTAQIKEMATLINFQGHSISHPYLTRLANEEVDKELGESKKIIESITAKGVNVFAYPIGDYDQRIMDITKKYYKYAVLNGGGIYTEGDGDYEIKRVYIPRNLDIEGFSRKVKGDN